MPVTNDYITAEGIDFLANQVTSLKRTANKALRLDDRDTPTWNWAMRNAKNLHSVDGGYRTEVKGNRDQEEEAWDGADTLTFQNAITPFPLKFYVGKTHFGNTESYDYLERLGIDMKYGAAPGDKGTAHAAETILNYMLETYDDIQEAKNRDRARRFFRANTDKPKYYTGLDGLLPADTNDTGTIGGADRSYALLQHNLIADVDLSNLWISMFQMNRELNRYRAGGSVRFVVAGDNFYEMLVHAYSPNANGSYLAADVPRGFDINVGYSEAAKFAEKFKVGLPGDAFLTPDGNLIVNDQILRDLQEIEQATISWLDRCYFLSSHVQMYYEKKDEYVNHGMARDQVVFHESWFSTMCQLIRAPRSCGIMLRATS